MSISQQCMRTVFDQQGVNTLKDKKNIDEIDDYYE